MQEGLEIVEHTSFRILLDKNNKYRVPRSVIRGALRRDLRIAFGAGCAVELGRQVPCNCKVCTEMRKITVMDSTSNFSEPPEIRYRIERNPYTSTVEEGSLFDLEVGHEGIPFRFVLRYRGYALPDELISVFRYWENKMAWLGGFSSTGKGRFSLDGLKVFVWDLSNNDGLASFIKERGLRGNEDDLTKKSFSGLTPLNSLKQTEHLTPCKDNLIPLWTEVSYAIDVGSPLLTADVISALIEPGNKDAIAYRKRVYSDGEKNPPRIQFAVKAETHRGIFRTAIGRRANDDDLVKDSHEDCAGVLCGIFGNEHEAGNIRFEDLVVDNEDIVEKHIDHVAIDRFNGGAVDKKKFDAFPLAGSPGKPLKLKGRFWIKKEISDDDKKRIAAALSDIRDGLYPLGGRGGAGYGWVTKLCLENVPEEIKNAMRDSTPYTTESTPPASYEFPKVNVPAWKPDLYYFPYIFLHPHSTVKREKKVVGHEKFHDNFISGKIVCTLETLTPLIIPDTGPENVKVENEHEKYDFFSINEETMIPGSEICGVISAIYESLTNSCFRIFEEERYISRRITPPKKKEKEKKDEPQIKCGIVEEKNGKFTIITTWKTIRGKKKNKELYLYRLPLYDDKDVTNAIPFDKSKEKYEERRQEIEDAMEWNEEIAKIAKKNCTFLNDPCRVAEKEDILQGKQEVCFRLEKGKNPSDYLAYLTDEKSDSRDVCEGYVKFTGLNTVQIDKSSTLKFKKDEYDRFLKKYFDEAKITVTEEGNDVSVDLCGIEEEKLKALETVFNDIVTGDIYSLNSRHNTYEWRSSLKEKYPRPRLWFIKDSVQYNIPKRCERVFLASTNRNKTTNKYEIPPKVRSQYNSILEDYKKNFDHVEEKFRTITQNEKLSDGDLVYFIPDANDTCAAAVFPVPLSRKADGKTLGGRLPHSSLFPCVKEKAVDIPAEAAKYLDSKVLQLHNEGVCPACRLLGTTFYKGRVRFGFAKLENNAAWYSENNGGDGYLTLPLLEQPRATWPLPDNKSEIPGRKFYYHHHGWKDVKGEKKTKNNCSVKALDKGNRFSFEIYFENLHPWELGVLLYSLELEQKNNLAHKMGKAKAFGFGSVRITVENIWEMDKEGNWTNSNQKKNDWLETGFKMLEDKEWFNATNWYDVEHIKNLRTILRFPEENEQTWKHQYPKLKKEEKENKSDTKGLPGYGYIELREMLAGTSPDIKKRFFIEPGFPWHPFPADVTTVKEDDKKGYRKDKKDAVRKHTGIVKSIDRKGGGLLIL
ncbi:MAG: hypothetical protein E3K37_02490 [Candidatus Kuenenia sp.]|nr:hypothetical protein [Candidatus Kuenenia hertensis]